MSFLEERHHLSQGISITATLVAFYKERSCWRMLVSVSAAAFCRGKARLEARLDQAERQSVRHGPIGRYERPAVKRSDRDRPGRCEHRQATWSSSGGNHGMRPMRSWIWAVCAQDLCWKGAGQKQKMSSCVPSFPFLFLLHVAISPASLLTVALAPCFLIRVLRYPPDRPNSKGMHIPLWLRMEHNEIEDSRHGGSRH